MKRIFLLFALLTVASAAHSSPGYLWRINPPAHSKWSGTYVQQAFVTQIISDPSGQYQNKLDTMTRQDAQFDWDVLGKDTAGMLRIQLTYNAVSSSAEMKLNDVVAPPALSQILSNRLEGLNRILRGATLTFTLSPAGKVSGLQGTAGIAAAFQADANRKDTGVGSAMGSDYKTFYTVRGLESLFSSGGKLPPHALQVGQSHNYQQIESEDPSFATVSNVKRTLTNRQSNLSTFAESGSVKITASRRLSGASATFDGSGTESSTFFVTEWNGVVARATGQVQLRGYYVASTAKTKLTVPSALTANYLLTMQPRDDDSGVVISPE